MVILGYGCLSLSLQCYSCILQQEKCYSDCPAIMMFSMINGPKILRLIVTLSVVIFFQGLSVASFHYVPSWSACRPLHKVTHFEEFSRSCWKQYMSRIFTIHFANLPDYWCLMAYSIYLITCMHEPTKFNVFLLPPNSNVVVRVFRAVNCYPFHRQIDGLTKSRSWWIWEAETSCN